LLKRYEELLGRIKENLSGGTGGTSGGTSTGGVDA
jgi:hypothetical protein